MGSILSETFSVDDSSTGFLILGFGDPHGLESRQGAENRSSDPYQEFSLGGCDNLDFHGGWSQSSDFFAETFGDAWVHGGSTAHHDVAVEIFSDIDVALQD